MKLQSLPFFFRKAPDGKQPVNQQTELPAEQKLESLKGCFVNIRDIASSVESSIKGLVNAEPGINKTARMQRLVDDIRQMSYNDYRSFVGQLNEMRRTLNFSDLNLYKDEQESKTSRLQNALYNLKLIRRYMLKEGKIVSDDKIVDEALMLARSAYPSGINVINAEWNTKKPISLDAKKEKKFTTGSGAWFTIRPSVSQKNAIEIVYPYTKTEGGRSIASVQILKNGESAILGRRLRQNELFNERLKGREGSGIRPIGVQPSCDVGDDTRFSRAGIMVTLKDNQVFVFDRGSRTKISCPNDDGKSVVTYSPTVMRTKDGVMFGQTLSV